MPRDDLPPSALVSRPSGWTGRAALFTVGALIAGYAAVPRVLWSSWDYLYFPIAWFFEGGLIAIAACMGLSFLATRHGSFRPLTSEANRFLLWGFLLGYCLVFSLGFQWTGEWVRFTLFMAGLSHEQNLSGIGPADWQIYYWGGDGFAGLENDYYLVHDPTNRLAAVPVDDTLPGLKCPVVDRAFLYGWHLLITFNCTLQ